MKSDYGPKNDLKKLEGNINFKLKYFLILIFLYHLEKDSYS